MSFRTYASRAVVARGLGLAVAVGFLFGAPEEVRPEVTQSVLRVLDVLAGRDGAEVVLGEGHEVSQNLLTENGGHKITARGSRTVNQRCGVTVAVTL